MPKHKIKKELRVLSTRDFPRAIIHVDMDSFFASCEQQRDPHLWGRPVCIGKERGIATSMSIEAKRAGVTRGMSIREIKETCPECAILPSDYETFGLYSIRIYDIVRQYSADVEEYSVDECFADITGMRRVLGMSYEEIIQNIKHDIDTQLGTVCSIGLAPSKTLAKVASKWEKPNGTTIIPGRLIQYYLYELPIGKVWGIGKAREHFLVSQGIKTALDFAYQPEWWVKENLYKPEVEIWHELRGESVKELQTEPIDEYKSISKRKTFTPATNNKAEVFSRLSKNIENACIKARRYGLASPEISFSLRSENFLSWGTTIRFSSLISDPITFIEAIEPLFEQIFNPNIKYRTTYFAMHKLSKAPMQMDLFGAHIKEENRNILFEVVDRVNARFGKHAVRVGDINLAMEKGDHQGERSELPWRQKGENLLPGETKRRRVNIPYAGWVK